MGVTNKNTRAREVPHLFLALLRQTHVLVCGHTQTSLSCGELLYFIVQNAVNRNYFSLNSTQRVRQTPSLSGENLHHGWM